MAKDGLPASGVLSAAFPAERIPRKHHLELWRRVCSIECNVVPLTPDWGFWGDVSSWSVADLLITHQRISATRYERTARHVEQNNSEWLIVWRVLKGSQAAVIDDRVHMRWDPTTIGVQDWSIPYVAVASDYELITVAVPRERVSAADFMGHKSPAVGWEVASAQGQLLCMAVENLLAQLPRLTNEEAPAIAAGFTGLVGGLLLSEADLLRNHYAETSRIDAMKQFVNEHLRDPTLGVLMLCERFHCSRATVYRLFEAEGGVASYIQRQRLHTCMRELTRIQNPPKGVLEQVASAWGFTNPHRFSRLFKAQFDLSPQEALRAQTPNSGKETERRDEQDYWQNAKLLSDWMNSRRCR
ncbi:helix-turn-helix domain-containing protein [Pseudohaliea rubra]|uniref:Transcriptional regulator, AraC family n=1 Tax=Pseudohaliea rubra DSM 19751 TaxID=1265313 RepID=A0A095VN64_9GAMM|nr:helix-turn-helix domain-containing protein [Pseudohaliea rubra]KGE02825.1 Transcriptional regulator, AraC family [Pseudohaliea rubra DSM 19751]